MREKKRGTSLREREKDVNLPAERSCLSHGLLLADRIHAGGGQCVGGGQGGDSGEHGGCEEDSCDELFMVSLQNCEPLPARFSMWGPVGQLSMHLGGLGGLGGHQ